MGKDVASFGDVVIFSFSPNKTITTGEGGMIVTDDEELAEKAGIIMGSRVSLSIIIPNKNGSKTLSKCIKSILRNLRYMEDGDYEIILIDDCSNDNSLEIAKQFPEIKVLVNDKNFGASHTRNRGISNSSGEFIAFVDNDIYLSEDCLRKLMRFINDYDIVYPTVIYENGEILSPAMDVERKYIRRSPVFLIRRDALNKLDEFFDENYFVYYEDVDFFFRCFLAGLRSKYVSDALAYHAVLPDRNLEKRFYLETKNKLYCFIKFSGIPKDVREFFKIPTIKDFLGMFFVALSNKNIFADCKMQEKIGSSRMKLLYLFLKALIWNLMHLRVSLKKRRAVKKMLKSGGGHGTYKTNG